MNLSMFNYKLCFLLHDMQYFNGYYPGLLLLCVDDELELEANRSMPPSSTMPRTRKPSAQYSFPPDARLLTLCRDLS